MTSKGLKCTCTFLARWAILARLENIVTFLVLDNLFVQSNQSINQFNYASLAMPDLRSNRQNLINSLRKQGIWLIGYLVILSVVAWLCTEVWEKEAFSLDRSLLLWIHQFANPQLDRVMLFITALGDPGMVIIVFISTIAWLGMKRRYSDGIRFLIICAGGLLINQVMKLFFAKPRPELWTQLISEHSFSFPSGHAVGSMVVYGFIGYSDRANKAA
jgi:PAP2 superfamily